ncbi:NUDIX hydrolase [Frigidibacter sp. MR17.24]|uniref:NUDIX hydrolase n=1 Tax=Frigidibacter sp. MR17.24 TaxID=3127345 RepID=UPI0030129D4B
MTDHRPDATSASSPVSNPVSGTAPGPDAAPLPIRDAATVIALRRTGSGPAVLMGQRGAGAAFMPSKFVFPGGAADPGDAGLPFARPLETACAARLGPTAATLAGAAIRELFEETGLRLGRPGAWQDPPADWADFAATGLRPDALPLRFIFRAITPRGRPRRFDARFLLIDAADLDGDPDDFSRATDELSHLAWVPLAETRALDLPFITEVVLAEVSAALAAAGNGPIPRPAGVPFFDNSGAVSRFRRIA